jgi:hypothetical protein
MTENMLPKAGEDEPEFRWRKIDPEEDQIMTISEFIESVAAGAYNDYDGYGLCAIDGEWVSDLRIYPSNLDRYAWTTHVCWIGA